MYLIIYYLCVCVCVVHIVYAHAEVSVGCLVPNSITCCLTLLRSGLKSWCETSSCKAPVSPFPAPNIEITCMVTTCCFPYLVAGSELGSTCMCNKNSFQKSHLFCFREMKSKSIFSGESYVIWLTFQSALCTIWGLFLMALHLI